jgi:hypothetical protein
VAAFDQKLLDLHRVLLVVMCRPGAERNRIAPPVTHDVPTGTVLEMASLQGCGGWNHDHFGSLVPTVGSVGCAGIECHCAAADYDSDDEHHERTRH